MLSFYIGAINLTTSHRFIVKMRLKKRSANRLDIVGIQALTPVKLRIVPIAAQVPVVRNQKKLVTRCRKSVIDSSEAEKRQEEFFIEANPHRSHKLFSKINIMESWTMFNNSISFELLNC